MKQQDILMWLCPLVAIRKTVDFPVGCDKLHHSNNKEIMWTWKYGIVHLASEIKQIKVINKKKMH